MGDLISRSKAIKITEEEMEKKLSYEVHNAQIDIMFRIKEMPTAYDVEKVVQQLEEKISSYESCVETTIKEVDKKPQNVSTFEMCSLHNNRGYLNGLKKALEIVKSGGVDAEQKGGV